MKGFVYILRDSNGRYYVGSTSDINRRLKQHYSGHTSTTRRMQNPEMVFSQEYPDLEVARKVERRIKRLKRRDYIEQIIADGYIKILPP